MENQSRNNRLVDNSPKLITQWVESRKDIPCCIEVSRKAVPTIAFEEPFISSSSLSTGITGLTGVFRIYKNNIYSSFLCFVGEELTELVETPIAQQSIESPTFSLFSYSFQVLQHDCTPCGESIDNLFGNCVVDLPHKPYLLTRKTFEVSSGRASVFTLKSTLQLPHFAKGVVYSLKKSAIACDCKVVYSEVDTNVVNRTCRTSKGINLFRDNYVQPHTTFEIANQFPTTNLPIKIFGVVIGECERILLTPFKGKKTTLSFFEFNPKTSSIISNGKKFLERRLGVGFFECLTNLCDTGHNQLSRKFTGFSDSVIDYVVKFKAVVGDVKTNIYYLVSDFRVFLTSIDKNLFMWKTNLYCTVHINLLYYGFKNGGEVPIPPPIEMGGLLGTRL